MNKEEQSKRTDGTPIEIEHKFLIARPDESVLAAQPDVRILQIEQIYLPSEPGETNRVRRTSEAGEVHYYHTKKRRINAMSAYEEEREIPLEEYSAFVRGANPHRRIIRKTRYKFPHAGFICEIDVYPFWKDRAILEIEVTDERIVPPLPDFVRILKDVTKDRRYKNARLAKEIPADTRRAVKNQKKNKYNKYRKTHK